MPLKLIILLDFNALEESIIVITQASTDDGKEKKKIVLNTNIRGVI